MNLIDKLSKYFPLDEYWIVEKEDTIRIGIHGNRDDGIHIDKLALEYIEDNQLKRVVNLIKKGNLLPEPLTYEEKIERFLQERGVL